MSKLVRYCFLANEFNLLGLKARYRIRELSKQFPQNKKKDIKSFYGSHPDLGPASHNPQCNYFDNKHINLSKILNKQSFQDLLKCEQSCSEKIHSVFRR